MHYHGVTFNILGYKQLSYDVKFYKDNKSYSSTSKDLTFYGKTLYSNTCSTNSNGKIQLNLENGEYGVWEGSTVSGYELDQSIYYIRIYEGYITIISEDEFNSNNATITVDDTIKVDSSSINDQLNSIINNYSYELDHIELNGKSLGTSMSSLPSSVSDGDVIGIYLVDATGQYYVEYFDHLSDDFLSLEFLGEDVISYNKSDIFSENGDDCIEIDFETIDDVLVSIGVKNMLCYVYTDYLLDAYSTSSSCEGFYDTIINNMGSMTDELLVTFSNAYWAAGDLKDGVIQMDYMSIDSNVYVFIIPDYGVSYSYNALVYEYPYGKISSAEQVKTYSFDYKQSDIVNVDGTDCIKINYSSIDSKLKSYGATGYTCFVYGADFYDGSGVDCSGLYESGLADGNDETLINNAYATWTVGSYSKAIINNEYVTAGDDVYVFITDEDAYDAEYSYNALVYEYPYGSISNAEQTKTYTLTYKNSDIVSIDGTDCVKIDYSTIDSKLKSYGATGYICFVYGADFYDGSGVDCSGLYESGLADGSDETLINNAYATWTVGSYSKAIINNEYVTAGDDVYVFITDENAYSYTVHYVGIIMESWNSDMIYTDYSNYDYVTTSYGINDNGIDYAVINYDKIEEHLLDIYSKNSSATYAFVTNGVEYYTFHNDYYDTECISCTGIDSSYEWLNNVYDYSSKSWSYGTNDAWGSYINDFSHDYCLNGSELYVYIFNDK